MAQPNLTLIDALRRTAAKLQKGAPYQWGHMGSCNCGNLAQELTTLTKAEIHEHALAVGRGDWQEQLNDYCPTSGLPMDLLIADMLEAGLTSSDLQHLERLTDRRILERLPREKRYLRHNFRDDVILYINAWADLLEEQLLNKIKLPNLEEIEEGVLA
ncbi:hypothetical protein [Persicitalea jodogahamensis]|uniref:Uncharacterized protein n=1 Tax=Persicitalea jodogahamensis TaxID=402147 RepID=A0A8J3DF29_9BACT|nr:hypothetical protein [Persicitalea jodogahamensis]GHB85459.1 hypothetical protein GCM10007390_46040 [Persicitalea jodogahamensis]